MKPHITNPFRSRVSPIAARLSVPLAASMAALLFQGSSTFAANLYWDNNSGANSNWSNANNWATTAAGGTNPANAPGAGDNAFFSITSLTGATLNMSNQSARSLTFAGTSTGGVTIKASTTGTANQTLSLGSGGITVASGAGPVSLGIAPGTNGNLLIDLTGSQTWTNNSASDLTWGSSGSISSLSRPAGTLLTFVNTSTGGFKIATQAVPNTNDIIGNWGFFGSGAAAQYATNNAGTMAGFTGTVAADADALTSATTNYELSSTGTTTLTDVRTANTIRSSGAGYTIDLGTTGANTLTLNGILAVGASGDLTIQRSSGTGTVVAGAEMIVRGIQNIAISAPISGGGITTDSGTLTLSGDNTYTGTTVINNGILAISHANALGDTAGNTTFAATGATTGAQLKLSGGINSPENITITGTTEASDFTAAITNSSGTNTLSGNITLNPSAGIRLAAGSGQLTLAGNLSVTGATARTVVFQASTGGAIIVNNAIDNNIGTLRILGTYNGGASNGVTLKAASTAIGSTEVIEKGLLKLGVTDALNTTAGLTLGQASTFTGFDHGTFDLAGFDQTVAAFVGSKNTSNIGANSTRVVTNSAASGTSVLTVGKGLPDTATHTFNGVILDGATAAVALTKIGAGTQTLVGDSNYSGVTTISVGILAISHANALGTTAGNTTIAATGSTSTGGQLRLSGGINSAENIAITGGSENSGFAKIIDNISGTNTLSGDITLENNANTAGARLGATAGQLTFAGDISRTGTPRGLTFQASGSSAIIVDKAIANGGGNLNIFSFAGTGTGTVTLKGVSGSGIGATLIIQNGTLKLGVTDALNTTANLTLGVTTTGNDIATFDLAGFNQTVNALIGTPATTTPAANSNRKVTNSAASGTNTLTVGNGDGTGTFNGVIVDGATAKVALVKTGSGTETLAGVNTYSGDTTVSGGTLVLANPNASNETSTVTIATDAFLNLNFAGTDTVGELVIGSTPMGAGVYGNSGSVSPVIPLSQITGSGTITVSSGGYSAWQSANSTTQTIDQDHDNDGVSNGVEFFIYGPVAASGFTPLPGVDNNAGTLSVTWTKAAGYTGTYGAGFVVETSASLATGTWNTEPNPGSTISFPSANEVKYTFPAGSRNFARLKVTGP